MKTPIFMPTIVKALALATTTVAGLGVVAAPAAAQSRTAIATADVQAAISRSAAAAAARTQMQTTYAAQIKALNDRSAQIEAELAGLAAAFNTARAAPNASEASLRPSADAFQRRRTSAQAELERLNQPIALAEAYVTEQISAQAEAAVIAAMAARKVDLVIQPGAVIKSQPYVDITETIVAELNRRVPSASIVPPSGWQPGRRGQAPVQPAQPQQPPATQPQGR